MSYRVSLQYLEKRIVEKRLSDWEAKIGLCKRSFWEFCRHMVPEFFTDIKGEAYLRRLSRDMQDLVSDRLVNSSGVLVRKYALSLPAQWGKSLLTDMLFLWLIGKYPQESYMRNSYSAEQYMDLSRRVRKWINSYRYQEIFPDIKLRKDQKSVFSWAIEGSRTNTYFGGGPNSGISGKGVSKLAVFDDFCKNMNEALSPVMMDLTWTFYKDTHRQRMHRGCYEMVIGTRYSKQDLIGRLQEKEPDLWKFVSISGIRIDKKHKRIESLCEEVKTTRELIDLKNLMEPFEFAAEIEQEPIEVKGLLFPKEELNYYKLEEVPSDPDIVIGQCDPKFKGLDFLSSIIAYRVENDIYIVDVIVSQEDPVVTQPLVANQIVKYEPVLYYIESNNIGDIYARDVEDILDQEYRYCKTTIVRQLTTKNKFLKILLQSGKIKKHFWFLDATEYVAGSAYDIFMRQLWSFVKVGNKRHDDAADALAMLSENIFSVQKPRIRFIDID